MSWFVKTVSELGSGSAAKTDFPKKGTDTAAITAASNIAAGRHLPPAVRRCRTFLSSFMDSVPPLYLQ